jgi:hypothetical protein
MFKYLIIFLLIINLSSGNVVDNSIEINKLQTILDSYHFIYKPELDVFDCVDMSVANYNFFKARGYNVSIAIKEDGFMPNGAKTGHCFAIVELTNGWIGIETKQAVINTSRSIGKVISIPELREICSTPEEVYRKDRRGYPIITWNVIEKN